jgi:hypothetical protein
VVATFSKIAISLKLCLIGIAPILLGCAHSESMPLGQVDLSVRGAILQRTVTTPRNQGIAAALVLSDNEGIKTAFGSHPDWPLVVRLIVVEAKSGSKILDYRIQSSSMKYTSWYLPSTSVDICDLWIDQVHESQECMFFIEVVNPAKTLGHGRLTLDWVENADSL